MNTVGNEMTVDRGPSLFRLLSRNVESIFPNCSKSPRIPPSQEPRMVLKERRGCEKGLEHLRRSLLLAREERYGEKKGR